MALIQKLLVRYQTEGLWNFASVGGQFRNFHSFSPHFTRFKHRSLNKSHRNTNGLYKQEIKDLNFDENDMVLSSKEKNAKIQEVALDRSQQLQDKISTEYSISETKHLDIVKPEMRSSWRELSAAELLANAKEDFGKDNLNTEFLSDFAETDELANLPDFHKHKNRPKVCLAFILLNLLLKILKHSFMPVHNFISKCDFCLD